MQYIKATFEKSKSGRCSTAMYNIIYNIDVAVTVGHYDSTDPGKGMYMYVIYIRYEYIGIRNKLVTAKRGRRGDLLDLGMFRRRGTSYNVQ